MTIGWTETKGFNTMKGQSIFQEFDRRMENEYP